MEVSSPRTGPVAAACSSSRLTLHNPRDIIEDYERHQCHEQKQSHLEHHLPVAKFQRLSAHAFISKKQQILLSIGDVTSLQSYRQNIRANRRSFDLRRPNSERDFT